MTSIRSFERLLLSPLSDDVTQLTESGDLRGKDYPKPSKTKSGRSTLSVSGFNPASSGEKKPKLRAESTRLLEPPINVNQDNRNGLGTVQKMDDIDSSECEEIVSNALKLPLLSTSSYDVSAKDAAKSITTSKIGIKSLVKDGSPSNVVEDEFLESVAQNSGRVEKLNKKARKPHPGDGNSSYETKTEVLVKSDLDVTEDTKSLVFDNLPPRQKIGQKVPSHYEDVLKKKVDQKVVSHDGDGLKSVPGELPSLSSGKKKSKGSQSQPAPGSEFSENGSLDNSVAKAKKISNSDVLKRVNGKTTDKYKDFFGELDIEQYDEEIASEEMNPPPKVKDSELVEKRSMAGRNNSNDRFSHIGSHPKLPSSRPPLPGKWPSHDAAAPVAAPLVQEDWVQCDKCHTWRLLPLGTNPESLPDRWLCSMLDWLPGMNRCNISEEETTTALRALYQPQASLVPPPPASGGQLDQFAHPSRTSLGESPSDAGKSNEDFNVSGGKRKYGTKDVMGTTSQDGPVPSSNLENNLQASAKSRNCNLNHSSVEEFVSRYAEQPLNGLSGDKYGIDKEKRVLLDSNSEEGTEMKSRMKDRRENDIDFPRASKKIKMEDRQNRDDTPTSGPGGAASKGGRSSSSVSGKDSRRSSNGPKDSKSDLKKSSVSSGDGPVQIDKSGPDVSLKKRKGREHYHGDVDSVPSKSSQRHSQGSRAYLEDTKENERRKEKKLRVSKSEGKDSSGSKHVSVSGKRGRGTTDHKLGHDLDCTPPRRSMDPVGQGQPSLAATSSSSKVSGSRKSKTSLQEMKDSPVESVSSSPFRLSGAEKSSQVRTSVAGRDDSQDVGIFAAASARKSFEREDTGVGDQSLKTKDNSFKGIHPSTLESTVRDFQERDSEYGNPNSKTGALGQGSSNGNEAAREEYIKAGRNKFPEKSASSSDRTEKHSISKKESTGKLVDNSKVESQLPISGRDGTASGPDVSSSREMQNVPQDSDTDRSSRKSDKTTTEVPGRGKSHSLPPLVRGQTDSGTRLHPIAESQKEYGECEELNETSKASKQSKKADKQNGNQHDNMRHPTPPTSKPRDIDAPSPARKDPLNQAVTNAVKEAKDLKHLADRLKVLFCLLFCSLMHRFHQALSELTLFLQNSGSPDSTGYYFQAALKFLHGASLLESGNSEIRSVQIYSSTAKLCEFCAHEYEKSKDMAAAALAYKCMEVAYLRVVYTSNNSASKCRNELLTALQISPTGESPSSSASDVDNLNNPVMGDKGVQTKNVDSPQVAGNQVLTPKNRASFMRLISYAQDVNNAMEASRKCQSAFAAANARFSGPQYKEGMSSVKKALDFNFQDVERLLRLVRVAIEAVELQSKAK
ncbi:OLC1v1004250C3 [Oldenlandia corymbosa var. corymbosa]|nr:OLC1v1004250C3 [Oldenlandia corymbosa var. corymbosa]